MILMFQNSFNKYSKNLSTVINPIHFILRNNYLFKTQFTVTNKTLCYNNDKAPTLSIFSNSDLLYNSSLENTPLNFSLLINPAIYLIICHYNNRAYIGQTSNLCQRISTHFTKLKGGNHYCRLLQADYNKYQNKNVSSKKNSQQDSKKPAFSFLVLEIGESLKDRKLRDQQEKKWAHEILNVQRILAQKTINFRMPCLCKIENQGKGNNFDLNTDFEIFYNHEYQFNKLFAPKLDGIQSPNCLKYIERDSGIFESYPELFGQNSKSFINWWK